uniref:Uncharacterized protein LOC108051505 n=1 Tax=Drosophila rhopaloa TaxID=1041015 RepID=A0A6P4FVA6_DRORH
MVLVEIIKEVFYRESRVCYLIAVRTPFVRQPSHFIESFDDLEKLSEVFYPKEFSSEKNSNTQALYIVDRAVLLPKMTYRKALAEDNDDIIALQEIEMPELREELGDYYIAEEVMRQDSEAEKSFLVVAETSNQCEETEMVLFLWMTTDIDILFANSDLKDS